MVTFSEDLKYSWSFSNEIRGIVSHFFTTKFLCESCMNLDVDSVRVDFQLDQKISKRRFFQDIKNSFQWVIGNGLKPTQFFSFQNISTNTVTRDVQSFEQNGLWLAGWLSSDQNFCANLAQTCDEHMLKISKRYLDSYLNYC